MQLGCLPRKKHGDGKLLMVIIFLFLMGLLDESFAGAWRLGVIVRVSTTVLQLQIIYNPKITKHS